MVRLLKSLHNKDAKERAEPLIKELSSIGPLTDNLWWQMTEIEDHLPVDNPWIEKKYWQYHGIVIELIKAVEEHMRVHEEISDEQIHEIIGTDLYAIEPLAVYSKTMIMTSNGNRINLLEASRRKGQLCYFEIQGRKFVIFAQADKKLPSRGIVLIDNTGKSTLDQAMINFTVRGQESDNRFEAYLRTENIRGGTRALGQVQRVMTMIQSNRPILIDVEGGDTTIALEFARKNPGIDVITFDPYDITSQYNDYAVDWINGKLAAQQAEADLPNLAVLKAHVFGFIKNFPVSRIRYLVMVNPQNDVASTLLKHSKGERHEIGFEVLKRKLAPSATIVIKTLPPLRMFEQNGRTMDHFDFQPVGESFLGVNLIEPSKKWIAFQGQEEGMETQVHVLNINPAMNVSMPNRGGIDLTPANMNLQTQNSNGEIKFHMDPAMLQQLQNAPGFVPVIINIQPLKSLQEFLGI